MKGGGKFGNWYGKGNSYGGKGGKGYHRKGISDMDTSNGMSYDMPWMETTGESPKWPSQTLYVIHGSVRLD